jgi:DNA-binding HxlR family transcriptional regulator
LYLTRVGNESIPILRYTFVAPFDLAESISLAKANLEHGKWIVENPIVPSFPISACPIATSLGVLGRKWSLLILRDIAMRKEQRFTELLKSVDGITRRVLSMRLRELESEGIIVRSVDKTKRPLRIS